MLRRYDPDAGRVLFNGHDARDLSLASLRQQIGLVPQGSLLLACSIKENIKIADLEASDDAVEAASRLADAHGFIERLPMERLA